MGEGAWEWEWFEPASATRSAAVIMRCMTATGTAGLAAAVPAVPAVAGSRSRATGRAGWRSAAHGSC